MSASDQIGRITLTKEEQLRIDDLAASFLEGSDELMSLSEALTETVKRHIQRHIKRTMTAYLESMP